MLMKRVLTSLLTALVLLSGPAVTAMAQDYVPTPVTISKDKVKYKGKTYYSHVVLERQTLYSIAQAYGVTVQEIYDANPGLTVLKKNAIILIPDTSSRGYEPPAATETVPEEKPAPKTETASAAGTEGAGQGYTEYIVKWNDTLYSIGEKFGVSVEEIQQANNLSDTKIKKRQVLRIPAPGSTPAPAQTTARQPVQPVPTPPATTVGSPIAPAPETAAVAQEAPVDTLLLRPWDRILSEYGIQPRQDVSFALVMPFRNGGKVSDNNMDFYGGVLLAVRDQAERRGIHARLNVYDVNELQRSSQLEEADFIIGPVSREAVSKTLQLRPETSVPVVSPLDPKVTSLLSSKSGIIHIPTSTDNQYADLIEWLRDDFSVGEKILLISEKDAAATDYTTKITARLAHTGLPYKTFSYGILQGRNITNALMEQLLKDRPNRILIASENEAFVNDVIRNLNVLTHKDYDIAVYAPARFRNFETIEVEALHNVRLHVSTAYHIDYSEEEVQHFLMEYRAFFRTEPGPYAFQGYDIARFLIRRVSSYGSAWQESLTEIPETLTQLRTEFKRSSGGSLENTGTRRILYDSDYTVKTVR